MKKEQSSIEWLIEKVSELIHESQYFELVNIEEQAKELHKKEILEAVKYGEAGYSKGCEQYYKENFE